VKQTYNKLVRDLIPDIITAKGEIPATRILNDQDFLRELDTKLQEEVNEYRADQNIEELADILEVIHGILDAKGVTFAELEKLRIDKAKKRGDFKKRIFLETVTR